jgi:hypothetical protein
MSYINTMSAISAVGYAQQAAGLLSQPNSSVAKFMNGWIALTKG